METEENNNTRDAPPDPELLALLSLNAWVDDDRQRYDNEAVLRVMETNPSAACAKYEFESAGRGHIIRYPLYRAVALGASLSVVTLMGNACPASIHEKGVFGNTALHSACAYQAPLETVSYFLNNMTPQEAGQRNKHGYTPLHNVCEYGASSLDVIVALVQKSPQTLTLKNKLGKTPYETAAAKGANEEVLSLLLPDETKGEEG